MHIWLQVFCFLYLLFSERSKGDKMMSVFPTSWVNQSLIMEPVEEKLEKQLNIEKEGELQVSLYTIICNKYMPVHG